MTRETFTSLLNEYKEFIDKSNKYYEFGIDLVDSKLSIAYNVDKMFEIIIKDTYTKEGIDWINWFVYENDFGRYGLGAYDESDKLICQDVDSLYDYIEQYKKWK